ncbi:MAG: family transposase [Clostridia bacterium]|nr:family transposase [Clostridia bacterium]
MKRRNYTAEFKAKIVIEVLREEMPLNETAAKYELNPNLVRRWKTEAVENMAAVFADKNEEINDIKSEYEKKIDNRSTLYYRKVEPSQEEIMIKHRIDEIYTEFAYYECRL